MKASQYAHLNRPAQRTFAAMLESAMEAANIPRDMQRDLVECMSEQLDENNGTAGGFDSYFSVRPR